MSSQNLEGHLPEMSFSSGQKMESTLVDAALGCVCCRVPALQASPPDLSFLERPAAWNGRAQRTCSWTGA